MRNYNDSKASNYSKQINEPKARAKLLEVKLDVRKAIAELFVLNTYVNNQLSKKDLVDSKILLLQLNTSVQKFLVITGYNTPESFDLMYCVAKDGSGIVKNVGDGGYEKGCSASISFTTKCSAANGKVKGGCVD